LARNQLTDAACRYCLRDREAITLPESWASRSCRGGASDVHAPARSICDAAQPNHQFHRASML